MTLVWGYLLNADNKVTTVLAITEGCVSAYGILPASKKRKNRSKWLSDKFINVLFSVKCFLILVYLGDFSVCKWKCKSLS